MSWNRIPLTDAQKQIVIDGYANCVPNSIIAEQIGVRTDQVKRIAQRLKCTRSNSDPENKKKKRNALEHWYKSNGYKFGRPYEPLK